MSTFSDLAYSCYKIQNRLTRERIQGTYECSYWGSHLVSHEYIENSGDKDFPLKAMSRRCDDDHISPSFNSFHRKSHEVLVVVTCTITEK